MILLIALSAGVAVYALVYVLTEKKDAPGEAVRRRLGHLNRDRYSDAFRSLSELEKPFRDRVLRPLVKKLSGWITNLLPVSSRGGNEKQKKMLQQAGWTISSEEYTVVQLVTMAGCGLFGLILGILLRKSALYVILYFFLGAFASYAILRYICSCAATHRIAAMERQIPDLLDLLSVSMAAGLGFERALLHVIETMDGPLVDEFAVTYREMTMGRTRKDALTLLGERCGVEEMVGVTSAIVQAGQLGIPICNVLQSQAAALRISRRSKVKEKAATVSTKMLLPMVGLIFPVLFIILLGPSIITIMEQFGA